MTAKEYVKQYYPKATIERQVQGRVIGAQTVYWIVRAERTAHMYIATGPTQSNAWVNAKQFIIKKLEKAAWMKKAGEWKQQHEEHVNALVTSVTTGYQPSQEDQQEPNLWKPEHWKWFLEQKV
jgi:hypothetical protein